MVKTDLRVGDLVFGIYKRGGGGRQFTRQRPAVGYIEYIDQEQEDGVGMTGVGGSYRWFPKELTKITEQDLANIFAHEGSF